MYLLNNNRNGKYNYRQPIKQQSVMMPIQHVPSQFKKENEIAIPKPRVKEMLWGEPTWLLFHTLAEKIKEEEFPKIRQEFLNQIMKICNNLPCPTCAQHATRYMNGVNFNNIQTKEQLKLFLFAFHNEVNRRKDYERFNVNDLSKYRNAVTVNVVRNFFYHFSKRSYNVRMAVDNVHRHKMLKEFRAWLEKNVYNFYE